MNWRESLLNEVAVMVYLDVANIIGWRSRLKWSVQIPKLVRQLKADFPNIKEIKAYYGLNERKLEESQALHADIRKAGAILREKPVKFIRRTIDSGAFFKKTTLNSMNQGMTTLVDNLVQAVQASGMEIIEPKCNFDVEITMDMMDDVDRASAFVLFSGDSDFFAPLQRLKLKGKRIYIVGVRGAVSYELKCISDILINVGKLYKRSETPASVLDLKAKIPPMAGPRESQGITSLQ